MYGESFGMKVVLSERLVRRACITVIVSWLVWVLSYGMMMLLGKISVPDSTLQSFPWIILMSISSMVFMIGGFMLALHLYLVTIGISLVSLIIGVAKVQRRQWSWSVVVFASVALLGHLFYYLIMHSIIGKGCG